MRPVFALVTTLLVSCTAVSCAATPPPPARPPERPPTASGEHQPRTRYRVGDFVVYRYQGSLTAPVLLREEIVAQEGNRLRIDVSATRGAEIRRWVQIVTDTVENERNNVIDALYEEAQGRYVRLPNEGERDVLRLYEWVLLEPEGRMADVHEGPCERDFAGKHFACSCTKGRNRWDGHDVAFESSDCSEFLWTHGPGGFRDVVTGAPILLTEVVEFGHRSGIGPQPFDPVTPVR